MSTQVTYTSSELSPEQDRRFEEGLAALRPAEHGHLIGGERRGGAATLEERNPAAHDERLGRFADGDERDVDDAVRAARAAQRRWSATPAGERIATFARAAELIARDGGLLAAAATLEVGKNRLESMGEVDEVVALIEYYSAQAAAGFDLPLAGGPGDLHRSVMRPFGVFGVIAPFNFPIALVAGPAVAAMLAGNAVVAKPSPTTSLVALMLGDLLAEAGLPPGVFNVVTGGDGAGRALVAHPGLDGLVFTGSLVVGQAVARAFGTGAGHVRPCIVEMGGKNPAIVTAGADLEAAASGIARSAFGLSGQKCSACSRVLVEAGAHDDIVAALVTRAAEWTVADPRTPAARLGPVHTGAGYERFERTAAAARRDGAVAYGGRTLRDGDMAGGWFVEPTVVTGLPAGHAILREELFLPLVAVERVASLEEAIDRANDQVYGLTAGLYAESDDEVAEFLDRIEAGTLFVNRAAGATSGGWPGQQTYPGWKGSGSTNRGALGPRYVQQFLREQGHVIVGGGTAGRRSSGEPGTI